MFPASEKVPLAGVVSDDWQELVRDDKRGGAVNRISYEWCVLNGRLGREVLSTCSAANLKTTHAANAKQAPPVTLANT